MKLPLDQVLDYITLFAFTGELGQRAIVHQFSLQFIPPGFVDIAPPEFRTQTVEEAVNDSRRYRAMICNGSCWTQTRVRTDYHYRTPKKALWNLDSIPSRMINTF